ncbi:MAG: hypothetical protein ACLQOO_30365 [Terriglobia bacterium]
MDCATPEAATRLQDVLESLKVMQQMAWHNQNPNRANPFQALQVDASGPQAVLSLTTNYPAMVKH